MPEIKNYMETIVSDALDDMIGKLGGCTCDNCRYDVMAIVLNALPPKYVVTKKGQLYTKLSLLQHQLDVDVISEIAKAVELVKKRPRHESNYESAVK